MEAEYEGVSVKTNKMIIDISKHFEEMNVNVNKLSEEVTEIEKVVNDFMDLDSTKTVLANLETQYVIPKETFSQMYSRTFGFSVFNLGRSITPHQLS